MRPPRVFRAQVPVGREGRFAFGLGVVVLTMASVRLFTNFAVHASGPTSWIAFLPALFAILIFNLASKVEVGDEGVFVRWLFYRRFVSFGDVERVAYEPGVAGSGKSARPGYVTIQRKKGRPVRISARAEDAFALSNALDDAFDAWRTGQRSHFDARVLEREGRDAAGWLAHLRRLAATTGTFRDGGPTTQELAEVVDDAHATEAQRIAAAVILAKKGDADDRARLRVASEQTASPKLRIGIEAALADREEAIADALEKVDP